MAFALVTGGAGFIGSHIVEGLLKEGHKVRVVDSLITGYEKNLASVMDEIEFIKADIADDGVAEGACEGVDYVFHEAAVPTVPGSFEKPFVNQKSGEIATLKVLEAARKAGVKRLMFAASAAAYGNLPGLPKRESDPVDPLSPYAVSKLAGEYYLKSYALEHGLDTVSLRYFNVFGPRQDPNSQYSGVISVFHKLLSKGIQPKIYGNGGQTRDFIYVGDVARANIAAMNSQTPLNGSVINIAGGKAVSILQLAEMMAEALGVKLDPVIEPERSGDVRDSLADVSRANELLGFKAEVNIAEGLKWLCQTA